MEKLKSLQKDMIKVVLWNARSCPHDVDFFFWEVANYAQFGFIDRLQGRGRNTIEQAKADFKRIAKLNGWRRYKFIWNFSEPSN